MGFVKKFIVISLLTSLSGAVLAGDKPSRKDPTSEEVQALANTARLDSARKKKGYLKKYAARKRAEAGKPPGELFNKIARRQRLEESMNVMMEALKTAEGKEKEAIEARLAIVNRAIIEATNDLPPEFKDAMVEKVPPRPPIGSASYKKGARGKGVNLNEYLDVVRRTMGESGGIMGKAKR